MRAQWGNSGADTHWFMLATNAEKHVHVHVWWWMPWVLAMAHKQLQMRNSSGLERLSSAAWQIFYVNAANDAVIFPRMPTFIYLSLSLPSFSLFPFSVSASRTLAAAITLRKTLRVSITTGSRGRKTERERGRVCMWEREKDRIGHTLGDTHSRSWLQQQQLVSSQIR